MLDPGSLTLSSGLTLLSYVVAHLTAEMVWRQIPLVSSCWNKLAPTILLELAARTASLDPRRVNWVQLLLARGWRHPAGLQMDPQLMYFSRQLQSPAERHWYVCDQSKRSIVVHDSQELASAMARCAAQGSTAKCCMILVGASRGLEYLNLPDGIELVGLATGEQLESEIVSDHVNIGHGCRVSNIRFVGGVIRCADHATIEDSEFIGASLEITAGRNTHVTFEMYGTGALTVM